MYLSIVDPQSSLIPYCQLAYSPKLLATFKSILAVLLQSLMNMYSTAKNLELPDVRIPS